MEPNDVNKEMRIGPPSGEIRKDYPNVIYEQETTSEAFQAYVGASYGAMREAGFQIAMEVEHNERQGTFKYVVRTKETDRHEQRSQGALLLGLTEASRRRTESSGRGSQGNELVPQASGVSRQLLHGLIDNKDMYDAFKGYYGGLRWGTDQEKFVKAMFEHGTEYDDDSISSNLSGRFLNSLVYALDADIPYNQRDKWYQADPEDVLGKHKDLDYKRLRDPQFRSTEEGQRLMETYAKVSGQILGDSYYSGERTITPDGRLLPKPQIPLSRHPIIEALMCDEVSLDRPQPKYAMGPNDVVDILAYSDSHQAHEALISRINTRLPESHRRVFDGPDEFQHKRGNIGTLLRAYKDYEADPQARKLLSGDLLAVLEGYTGQGETAVSVRDEYRKYVRRNGEKYAGHEASQVKKIVGDIITVALGSPDGSLLGRAEDIIRANLPKREGDLVVERDPLAFRQEELMILVFDSVDKFSSGGRVAVIELLGSDLFGDPSRGSQLAEFARIRQRVAELRGQPKVLQALAKVRKFGLGIGEKSHKKEEARKNYSELTRLSDEMSEQLRRAKNEFLIGTIRRVIGGEVVGVEENSWNRLFSELVKRVEIGDYEMASLPEEYYALMDIARSPGLSDENKAEIAWHIAQQFEYVRSESAHSMVQVMVDLYGVMLGSPDNVSIPNRNTSHGLAAATHLARKHGRAMFKSASMEDLKLLDSYADGIRQHARRVANGELLPEHTDEKVDASGFQEWQRNKLQEFKYSMGELASVAEFYNEYLHLEAVKVRPDIYYSWLLQQLAPFWQKMQWEVGPGNRPTRQIQQLYRTMEDYVSNRLDIREQYPENFDALKNGNLDTFLMEMYRQMVLDHDIKYNSTVWREGLNFMHMAVAYMPEVVVQQIESKYKGTAFAKYIRDEHDRWNKEE